MQADRNRLAEFSPIGQVRQFRRRLPLRIAHPGSIVPSWSTARRNRSPSARRGHRGRRDRHRATTAHARRRAPLAGTRSRWRGSPYTARRNGPARGGTGGANAQVAVGTGWSGWDGGASRRRRRPPAGGRRAAQGPPRPPGHRGGRDRERSARGTAPGDIPPGIVRRGTGPAARKRPGREYHLGVAAPVETTRARHQESPMPGET